MRSRASRTHRRIGRYRHHEMGPAATRKLIAEGPEGQIRAVKLPLNWVEPAILSAASALTATMAATAATNARYALPTTARHAWLSSPPGQSCGLKAEDQSLLTVVAGSPPTSSYRSMTVVRRPSASLKRCQAARGSAEGSNPRRSQPGIQRPGANAVRVHLTQDAIEGGYSEPTEPLQEPRRNIWSLAAPRRLFVTMTKQQRQRRSARTV
jgi:hypothetical protein